MMKPLAILSVVALAACASQSSVSARPDASLITRPEINEAGPCSAYQLIERVRPLWLRERGAVSFTRETDIVVYLDGTSVGSLDALRNLQTDEIESIRFFDGRQATYRFGAGHVNGAILVTTRN